MMSASDRITGLAQTHAASYGATAEVDYGWGHPVLVNAEAETAFAREVAAELVGTENVGEIDLVTGSEDFAYMLERVPGSFVRLCNEDYTGYWDGYVLQLQKRQTPEDRP
jgi:hippurate hydrolase